MRSLALLALLALSACTRSPSSDTSAAHATVSAATPAVDPLAAPASPAPGGGGKGGGQNRKGDAPVYVDGTPVGVLRALEMPPSLHSRPVKQAGGWSIEEYYLFDYLRAIGVDPAKVRAVHVYGGSTVALLDAKELRRVGERVRFSFTMETRGKPRMHFPAEPINFGGGGAVGMINNMAIYVAKEPPVRKDDNMVMPDGSIAKGVPYTNEDTQPRGTRVYVDGKLTQTIKRRALPESARAGADDAKGTPYGVAKLVSSYGVDVAAVKAVDFVEADDLALRLDRAAWTAKSNDMAVVVGRKSHGKATLSLPTDNGSRDASLSAIEFYVKTQPPARAVATDDVGDDVPMDD